MEEKQNKKNKVQNQLKIPISLFYRFLLLFTN